MLAVLAHVLLLAAVLGQIVFLASRHRARWDLTSDKVLSLTDSTRSIIGKLDKQLLIQAYFSPKDELSVTLRAVRDGLDNFLDELVQLGNGKVLLQIVDPNSDKAISDECTRLGIQPLDLRDRSTTSMSVDRHWLDIRMRYGGQKQKVLKLAPMLAQNQMPTQLAMGLAMKPYLIESIITPGIKEVVTEGKRKFAYMEWPMANPGQPQGLGWNLMRTRSGTETRYEFQNVKSEDAPLLPDDVDTLFVYRPSELTDRLKYVIDQFVVRGGTLVVFADAVDYVIGQRRQFTKSPLRIDSADSKRPFTEQLSHYGLEWKPKLIADMQRNAYWPHPQRPQEFLVAAGGFLPQPIPYPYFFHAVDNDWSQQAEQLARDENGAVDEAKAEVYRNTLRPGMAAEELLFAPFKNMRRGPGFYWPTWVGLRQKAGGEADLPVGVEGKVLLWSSPLTLVEDPPANLNPFGFGDAMKRQQHYQNFIGGLSKRLEAEPRQQAPLMVEVRGTFSSFFAGSERPMRPSEIAEQEAKQAEQAAPETAGDAEQPGDDPEVARVGPELPDEPQDEQKPQAPPEADMVTTGSKPGRIVLIGDSDFLRDDMVQGVYMQQGGPASILGGVFWGSLLDWVAEDEDLAALHSRTPVDRTMKFLEDPAPGADAREVEQELAAKTSLLRWANVLLPAVLLGLFGLLVMFVRRSQKRAFLESVS